MRRITFQRRRYGRRLLLVIILLHVLAWLGRHLVLRLVAPAACLVSLSAFRGALDTVSVRIGRVGLINLSLYVFYRRGRLLDFFGRGSHVRVVDTLGLNLGLATFFLGL